MMENDETRQHNNRGGVSEPTASTVTGTGKRRGYRPMSTVLQAYSDKRVREKSLSVVIYNINDDTHGPYIYRTCATIIWFKVVTNPFQTHGDQTLELDKCGC